MLGQGLSVADLRPAGARISASLPSPVLREQFERKLTLLSKSWAALRVTAHAHTSFLLYTRCAEKFSLSSLSVTKKNKLLESGVLFRVASVSCVLYIENTNRRSTNFSLVERKGQTEYLETKNTRWIAVVIASANVTTYDTKFHWLLVFSSLDVICIAKQTPNVITAMLKRRQTIRRRRRSRDRSCWKPRIPMVYSSHSFVKSKYRWI